METDAGPASASVHGSGTTAVVLGHGAGSRRTQPALVRYADGLAGTGRTVVLFNFPYSEAGRSRIDPQPLLLSTVSRFAEAARAEGATRLVLGGRSMGGRMASYAVAGGLPADALIFLAYPLHPPGRVDRMRDAHLPQVLLPMLFLQGTRDDYARPDLLAGVLSRLPAARLVSVEDGDHSFHVRKRSGRNDRDVEGQLVAESAAWLDSLGL